MKILLLSVFSLFASVSFADCVIPGSSAKEKEAVGAAIAKITGGISSWTEVEKGTNVKETKNTIVVKINHKNPFGSSFKVGAKTEAISQICVSGSSVTISTAKGNVTLSGSSKKITVSVLGGLKKYQIMPSSKVVEKKAEAVPLEDYGSGEETTVLT